MGWLAKIGAAIVGGWSAAAEGVATVTAGIAIGPVAIVLLVILAIGLAWLYFH
jgi:hypothetical protein